MPCRCISGVTNTVCSVNVSSGAPGCRSAAQPCTMPPSQTATTTRPSRACAASQSRLYVCTASSMNAAGYSRAFTSRRFLAISAHTAPASLSVICLMVIRVPPCGAKTQEHGSWVRLSGMWKTRRLLYPQYTARGVRRQAMINPSQSARREARPTRRETAAPGVTDYITEIIIFLPKCEISVDRLTIL